MGKRQKAAILRVARVAPVMMLASCVNREALHPDDVLQKVAPDASVLIFSTSSKSQSLGFALGLTLFHVNDDATRGPVPGEKAAWSYYLDATHKPIDIPSTNVGIDWRALPPGRYVMVVGVFNQHECLFAAPEYSFSVTSGQVLYLGEFYREWSRLELQGSYARDVGYFRDHANSAKDVDVVPATVTSKNVDYPTRQSPTCNSVFSTRLADPHGTAAGTAFAIPR